MPERNDNSITVRLEPGMHTLTFTPRPKTVLQLLRKLELRPTSCLVILESRQALPEGALAEREEAATCAASDGRRLLTPDLHLWPGDVLTVRRVTSSG